MVNAMIKNATLLLLILCNNNTPSVECSKKAGRGHHKHGKRGDRSDTSQDTSRLNKKSLEDSYDLPAVEQVEKSVADELEKPVLEQMEKDFFDIDNFESADGANKMSGTFTVIEKGGITWVSNEKKTTSLANVESQASTSTESSSVSIDSSSDSEDSSSVSSNDSIESSSDESDSIESSSDSAAGGGGASTTKGNLRTTSTKSSSGAGVASTGTSKVTGAAATTATNKEVVSKKSSSKGNLRTSATKSSSDVGVANTDTSKVTGQETSKVPGAGTGKSKSSGNSIPAEGKPIIEDKHLEQGAINEFGEKPQVEEKEDKRACDGMDDYVYNQMGMGARAPVIEYTKNFALPDTVEDCPPFLCDKDYKDPRMVLFYYPDDDAIKFRQYYRRFGMSLLKLVEESTNNRDRIEIFAVSCCGNAGICERNKVTEYPTFKLIKKGETEQSALKAVFSGESLTGNDALDAVKGTYNFLYPDGP